MKNKLYFQDFPVNDYKDDLVGFEEEVNMLKEGIDSDAKIIGLISDYGSGKSSIIALLDKELDKNSYDLINVNLLDPDGKNDNLEAHKRMLIQLAKHKYYRDQRKLSYIIKRLNPNYKSISISTKNKTSLTFIWIALLLLIVSFLYKNGILSSLNFLSYEKHAQLISTLKEFCNISGIVGFLTLFITLIKSDLVCNYLKNDDVQKLNEFDLIEISEELVNNNKTTILVVEDLDRMTGYVEEFIKELNTYYSGMSKYKFIVAITPEDFKNMSSDNSADSKYKPFDMVLNLASVKNSDYAVILENLLLSKQHEIEHLMGININESLNNWIWLSFGKNMNIRRLKHRINDVFHLYMSLSNRFKGCYIEIKTCIAVVYLRDEYENEYENLVNEKDGNQFNLKTKVENFIVNNNYDSELTELDKDLYELIKSGYIDYSCEMYCYNYSKYNKIFDIYENEIVNDYMYNKEYKFDDAKITEVIEKNEEILINAINRRFALNIGIPSNVFDRKSIINLIIKDVSKEELIKFYKEYLLIDKMRINTTKNKLIKMKNSNFYLDENVKLYIQTVSEQLQEVGDVDSVTEIRLALLDIFNYNPLLLKDLYNESYPIISMKEIEKINDLNRFLSLLKYSLVNGENIQYIVEMIDKLFKEDNKEITIEVMDKINDDCIDYFFKNCTTLSKIDNIEKQKLFDKYKNKLNLFDYDDIKKINDNIKYSFEEVEQKAIEMLESRIITLDQYSTFINSLPNIHECSLQRLLYDDFCLPINEMIINEYKNLNMLYGFVKFRTINDGKIIIGNKKIKDQYAKMYSNENCIFNDYIVKCNDFLSYIRDNRIYEKYDIHRFMMMSNCEQTVNLLEYAFANLKDNIMLNEYFLNIDTIVCDELKLKKLVEENKHQIKQFNRETYDHFVKCIEFRSIKSIVSWVIRKEPVGV